MVKCLFGAVTIRRPQTYCFAILALSFLYDNVAAFASCKQGVIKREHYLVISIDWVLLTWIGFYIYIYIYINPAEVLQIHSPYLEPVQNLLK